jgi:hypothetical protein
LFVHPVHIIIIFSIIALGSVAWMAVSVRRKQQLPRQALAGAPEVDSLRQRVGVLEQIVTDPVTRLHREIEDLRSAN